MSVRGLAALLFCLLAFTAGAAEHAGHGPAPVAKSRPTLAIGAAFDAGGRLWQALAQDGYLYVRHSGDRGASFSPLVAVNPTPETILADGENRPKLAFGKAGEVYVSWTQGLERPYTGHVRFSRSLDGGKTFATPITVNDDRQPISHRFDALLVDPVGAVHLVWIDKRDQEAARQAGRPYAGAALYHTISRDGGASFAANRKLSDHSCECCRLALALDRDGTPLLLWRQVFGQNVRDHALLRLDGGEPQRVAVDDWRIDACPHHGPDLAIGADGTRHAVWFTNGLARQGLFYARAAQGQAFGAPMAFGDADRQAGHPQVLSLGSRLALAWKEFDGRQSLVRGQVSADDGLSWSAPRTLAATAGASDHPLLIADGARAFLAWNTAEGLRLVAVGE